MIYSETYLMMFKPRAKGGLQKSQFGFFINDFKGDFTP